MQAQATGCWRCLALHCCNCRLLPGSMQTLRRVGLPGLAMAKRSFAVRKTELFTFQFPNILHKYLGQNRVVMGVTVCNVTREIKTFV